MPRSLISSTDREFIAQRAEWRCEYCLAPQIVTGVTFHVEHITPKVCGGADERVNLALSCITCNGHKADHVTGIDSTTGRDVPLFHPRRDRWDRHFRFVPETLMIQGATPRSRATVSRLQMNERKQIDARELWVELEIYP